MSRHNEVFQSSQMYSGIDESNLPEYQLDMLNKLKEYNETAFERGQQGLLTGFPLFDEKLGGIQPGLILLAADANMGKSAVCAQMARQMAHNNENLYVIYMSLDDNFKTILPRFIASDQRIPIDVAKFPSKYDMPETMTLIERYVTGMSRLLRDVPRFKILDSNESQDIERLQEIIEEHLQAFAAEHNPDKKLVVFVDNFHDLKSRDVSFTSNNNKYEYMAEVLKEMVSMYDIPIICTAEIRKVDGKRPSTDDIRETVKIKFESNLILLLYNEVGIKDQAAKVFYQANSEDISKRPVIEMHWAKNKISSYKGRTYYLFHPEHSYLQEVPAVDQPYYDSKVYAS